MSRKGEIAAMEENLRLAEAKKRAIGLQLKMADAETERVLLEAEMTRARAAMARTSTPRFTSAPDPQKVFSSFQSAVTRAAVGASSNNNNAQGPDLSALKGPVGVVGGGVAAAVGIRAALQGRERFVAEQQRKEQIRREAVEMDARNRAVAEAAAAMALKRSSPAISLPKVDVASLGLAASAAVGVVAAGNLVATNTAISINPPAETYVYDLGDMEVPMTAVARKRLGLSSTYTTELDKRRMEKSAENAVMPMPGTGKGNANLIVTENIQIIPPVKPVAPMTNFEKKRLEGKAPKVETEDEPVMEYKQAPTPAPGPVEAAAMESVSVPVPVETPAPKTVNPEGSAKKKSLKQRLQELEDAKEYLSTEEYGQIRKDILQQL